MLDRIRTLLSTPEVTVPVDEALDTFREAKQAELDAARAEADTFHDDIHAALDEVGAALTALESYEHPDGHSMATDVVQNVARDRRRLLNRFDPDPAPGPLYDRTGELIEEFQTLTQKEAAILQRAAGVDAPFDAMKTVKQLHDTLGRFLSRDYEVLEQYDELQSLLDEHTALNDDLAALEQELDDIDTAPLRSRIEEKETELEQHRQHDDWETYEALQEKQDELAAAQRDVVSRVETAAGKMERGLKKLLYAVEHDDLSLPEEYVSVLKGVRSGDILPGLWSGDTAEHVAAAAAAAVDALPDDLLGERQQQKFAAAAATLQDLPAMQEELADRRAEESEVADRLAEYSLEEQAASLEEELDALQQELQNAATRRSLLRDRREQKQEQRHDVKQRIADLLNEALRADVTLT